MTTSELRHHRRPTGPASPSGTDLAPDASPLPEAPHPTPVAGLAAAGSVARAADAGEDPLGGTAVAPDVLTALRRHRGGGTPLPENVAGRFSEQYGTDLSDVRVHADAESDRLARSVQSVAFTHGEDIYFSQGSYAPHGGSGERLLAHELAHVVQHRTGDTGAGAGPTIGRADDPAERAADRMADQALQGVRRTAAPVAPSTLEPSSVDRFTMPWNKKKKGGGELKIGAPTNGRVMTEQEKGGVPDAKALIKQKEEQDAAEETANLMNLPVAETKEKKPKGPDDETLGAAAGLFDAAEKEAQDWAPDVSSNPSLPGGVVTKLLPKGAEITAVDKKNKVAKDSSTLTGDYRCSPGMLSAWNKTYSLLTISADERYIVRKDAIQDGEGYVKDAGPVFPIGDDGKVIEPKPEDIVQGELGDCYLEAALSSLAQRNPKAIMEMIKDFGTNVTVRLFDVDRTDPDKPTFTPRFVRVEKSRVRRGGNLVFDRGALWVGMIEKAYAAGKFGGSEEKTGQNRAQATASFANIADGFTAYAFEVLLGKPAKMTALQQSEGRENHELGGLPWTQAERDEYALNHPSGAYGALASMAALGDTAKVDTWMAWLTGGGYEKIFQLYVNVRGKGLTYLSGSIRIEDFQRVFADNGLAEDVAKPMLTYLQTYFPGKRGTAKYSRAQLKAWDDIVGALTAKKLVTAASDKTVARAPTGSGHSGGEAKAKGMVGGHAFTVLDWKIDDQGRRFVKMRNPWGSYSREYDFSKTKSTGGQAREVSGGDGVSWLELDDVTKRFQRIEVL